MENKIDSLKSQFPNIPHDIFLHYFLLSQRKIKNSSFVDAINDSPNNTWPAIDRMFNMASTATGKSSDQLIKLTGFNSIDLDPGRIDSAFAEIRTINYLNNQGFSNLQLIGASKTKNADLIANFKNNKYAIEVACSPWDINYRFTIEEMACWIVKKLYDDGKIIQLNNTAGKYKCDRKAFIGIINSAAAVALQTHIEFLSASKKAWDQLGKDNSLHIALVTGRMEMSIGPDDAVYPPWL